MVVREYEVVFVFFLLAFSALGTTCLTFIFLSLLENHVTPRYGTSDKDQTIHSADLLSGACVVISWLLQTTRMLKEL